MFFCVIIIQLQTSLHVKGNGNCNCVRCRSWCPYHFSLQDPGYIPIDIIKHIASFSTSRTVDQLRSTCRYCRNFVPKIHYVIPPSSYYQIMDIIHNLAAKNINQPISIKFHSLVRKITKDPTEFFSKLATIKTLTSIDLHQTILTPNYTEIQPLVTSGKILDFGMNVQDEKVFELSTQLTRLVLQSTAKISMLEKYISLRELEYFNWEETADIYKAISMPTALTKLDIRFLRLSGHDLQHLEQFTNLKVLKLHAWRSLSNMPTRSLLLPNLESLGIGLKMDMDSLSNSTNLTFLELHHHTPTHVTRITRLTNLQILTITVKSTRAERQFTCLQQLHLKVIELNGCNGPPLIKHFNTDCLIRLRVALPFDSPYLNDLTRLTGLESLHLDNPNGKKYRSCPKYSIEVSSLTRLTCLVVNAPQMKCNNLETLTALEHLVITSSFMKQGVIEHLTNLKHFSAKNVEDFDRISKLTKLEYLHCPAMMKNEMLSPLTNLTHLRIGSITSMLQLWLPNLEVLALRQKLEPEVFLSLSVLTTLTSLTAGSVVMTEQIKQGYPYLQMTRLQGIILRSPYEDFEGIALKLFDALPLLCTCS